MSQQNEMDRGLKQKFTHVLDMFDAMATFARRDEFPAPIRCSPLEDIRRGLIGFKVTIEVEDIDYAKEFWSPLSGHETNWHGLLRTPQGRDWVANATIDGELWRRSNPRHASTTRRYWSDDLLKC